MTQDKWKIDVCPMVHWDKLGQSDKQILSLSSVSEGRS